VTSDGRTVVASYRYGAFGELFATGGSDAALAERNPLRLLLQGRKGCVEGKWKGCA
jgi:hypothetical protein